MNRKSLLCKHLWIFFIIRDCLLIILIKYLILICPLLLFSSQLKGFGICANQINSEYIGEECTSTPQKGIEKKEMRVFYSNIEYSLTWYISTFICLLIVSITTIRIWEELYFFFCFFLRYTHIYYRYFLCARAEVRLAGHTHELSILYGCIRKNYELKKKREEILRIRNERIWWARQKRIPSILSFRTKRRTKNYDHRRARAVDIVLVVVDKFIYTIIIRKRTVLFYCWSFSISPCY
jgi:hypothetical protein